MDSAQFKQYPVEDEISRIHNAKTFDERKELCMHEDAANINNIEHMKHIIRKHYNAMMRELDERQKSLIKTAEERLAEIKNPSFPALPGVDA
jgi:hypothetical protein